ncbi:2-dehydropantoate 2-reductase [Pseudoalteromonas luteoviolacea B = ATCC 29581]|nr:2-dehydropantoate 2-reductase [Pseudoalteromonas luteoviolacea B = ATCC 29581]
MSGKNCHQNNKPRNNDTSKTGNTTPVYILGAGSLGLIFAHYLTKNTPVSLITREPTKSPFYYQNNQHRQVIPANSTSLENITFGTIRHVIVAVKAYQLDDALEQLLPKLATDAVILITHNGMSDLTLWLNKLTAKQRLFFATTTQGGYKPFSNEVHHRGEGATWLGELGKTSTLDIPFLHLLQHSIPMLTLHPTIELVRWQKLLINVAINPLSATEKATNGQLRQPKYASLVLGLLNEAVYIANQLGIKITLHESLMQAYLVMQNTSKNRSSMLQDCTLNRQTEIDAICGFLSKKGQELNYPTPFNDVMLKKIKHIEQRYTQST